MTAIGVSFPAAIDMNSSVIQGCFPNGFRAPVPPRPAPMPPPVAQRATMPRGAVFPPPRPVVPQQQQNQPVIQRFGAGTAMRLPDAMQTAASRSIGQPLQPAVRQMMESLFRTSFADVRVHVGPHVSAIGATSYTQGSNIHFAPGQYAPEHGVGRQKLAYELAHVVQQRAGRARNPFGGGVALVQDARLETEAQQFAHRQASAVPADRHALTGIQRDSRRNATEAIQRIEPLTLVLGGLGLAAIYGTWKYCVRGGASASGRGRYDQLPAGRVPVIKGKTMRIPRGTLIYHGTTDDPSEWWKTSTPGIRDDEDGGVSFTLIPRSTPKVRNHDVIIEYKFTRDADATVCASKTEFYALLNSASLLIGYAKAENEIKIRMEDAGYYLAYCGEYDGDPARPRLRRAEDIV
jgi:hypothetical protein